MEEKDRKKLLSAITKAVAIARVRESRINLLCDEYWQRKLKLLPLKALKNKLKFIIGNCSFRTLKVLHKKDIFAVDPDITFFANKCVRKRFGGTSAFSDKGEYCPK